MKMIRVPGSKSVSNRALVLSFLCEEAVALKGLLVCDDTRFLRHALDQLAEAPLQTPSVPTKSGHLPLTGEARRDFFIGNGGTPARFLAALSLVVDQSFRLHGVDRMHERPFGDLFEVLKALGVAIESETPGFLPAKFEAKNIQNKKISISGSISSQFISGLLLAGTKLPEGLIIQITDEIKSRPYVEMTVEMIQIFGGQVEVSDDFKQFHVLPGLKNPGTYHIPADCSSASYPLAWGLIKGEDVGIENKAEKTLQGDEKFVDFLKRLQASSAPLRPEGGSPREGGMVEFDFSKMPDVSMTGMIIAACTPGVWRFTGLESLRVKECDRIAAMEEGLKKLGVKVEVENDEVIIYGKSEWKIASQIIIDARDDHRIAMCFGILRNALDLDFEITDLHCVAKSWPSFWEDLADWSGKLRDVSSVIVSRSGPFSPDKSIPLSPPGKPGEQLPQQVGERKEYLIVRKPRKNHAWQFPQGGVDAGESFLEAAKRELAEECGAHLEIKFNNQNIKSIYKYLFPVDFRTCQGKKPCHKGAKVHFFEAEYTSGEVEVDNEEIVEARWVEKEALKDYFSTEYFEACFAE